MKLWAISLCRQSGVLTPEDPYAKWPGDGPVRAIVPTFTLFDYSFRPDHVTRDEWCAERVAVLPRIPRFSIWCGTMRTHEWPRRYNFETVVSGHLHLRSCRLGARLIWNV